MKEVNDFYLRYLYHNNWLILILAIVAGYFFSSLAERPVTKIGSWNIRNNFIKAVLNTLAFTILAVIGGFLIRLVFQIVLWPASLYDFFSAYSPAIKKSRFLKILVLAFFIISAFAISKLKEKFKIMFGLLYISGGLVTLVAGLRYMDPLAPLQTALALGGGTFLIIDGLSHVKVGNQEYKLRLQQKETNQTDNGTSA